MGTPIEPKPVKPDDLADLWFDACGYWDDCPDNATCEAYCNAGASCPPTITVDRGIGINPRYGIYNWKECYYYIFEPYHYCWTFGIYQFSGLSN